MALTDLSSSNYLRRQSQVFDTNPFMISWWGWRPSAGGGYAVAIGASGTLNHSRGRTGVATGGGDAGSVFAETTTTSVAFAFSSSASPVSTWFHGCAEFVAANLRAASLDGGSRVTNTTNRAANASDSVRIGANMDSGNPWSNTGALAEVSLWDAAGLSEAERLDLRDKLAAGRNPFAVNAETAQPWTGKLAAYWRLKDPTDLVDLSGNGHDLSMVGTLTTFASHPPVDELFLGASWREDLNTPTMVDLSEGDVQLRLRVGIENTGSGAAGTGYRWQFRKNGGSWTNLTATSNDVRTFDSAHFADGDDVPQLITSGDYFADNNAAEDATGALTLGAGLGAGERFESEVALEFLAADLSNADVLEFRLVLDDGTPLDSYGETPSCTIAVVLPSLMALERGMHRRIHSRLYSRVN